MEADDSDKLKDVPPSKAHRLFYPGVPVVLCAKAEARVSAMPVVSCLALSESPPMVGVACNPTSFTYWLLRKSGTFSLCWLDRRWARGMEYLASKSGRGGSADKVHEAGLRHKKGRVLNVPVLSESEAAMECTVASTLGFGDHILVVGRVESAYASSDFRDYWRFRTYEPILYTGWHGGLGYYAP